MQRALLGSLLLSMALPASAIPTTWEASGTIDYVSDTTGLLPFTVNFGDTWTLSMTLDTESLPQTTNGSTFSQFRGFEGGYLSIGSNVLDLPSTSFLTYVNIGSDATSHSLGIGFQGNDIPQFGSYIVNINFAGPGEGSLPVGAIPLEPPSLSSYSSFSYFTLTRFGNLDEANNSYVSASLSDNNVASLARVIPPSAVPEPGTLALLSVSLAGLAFSRKRREMKSP